jgi:hypothetical protein
MFLHNSLNVLVQIANKMGLQKKKGIRTFVDKRTMKLVAIKARDEMRFLYENLLKIQLYCVEHLGLWDFIRVVRQYINGEILS